MERFTELLPDLSVLDFIAEDTDLTDEVRALYTPGHTPWHMSVLVSSGGQKALIQDDVLIHPLQVTHEDWNANSHAYPIAFRVGTRCIESRSWGACDLSSCSRESLGSGMGEKGSNSSASSLTAFASSGESPSQESNSTCSLIASPLLALSV